MKKPDLSKLKIKPPSKQGMQRLLKNALRILVGSIIYAVAISLLLDPNQLAPGGVSGIAIIISHFSDLPTGLIMLAINMPLFVIGLIKLGIKTIFNTIVTTLFSTLLIDLCASYLPVITTNLLLATVFGGFLLAVGMAMVFKADSTTGGVDILVRIIRKKYPHLSSGQLFLVLDVGVIVAAGIVFQNVDIALYAALTVAVFSLAFDVFLYGGDSAELIYLISDKQDIIVERLLEELGIGVTYLEGEGAYSGKSKRVAFCAMKKQYLPKVQSIIKEEDEDAFLIIGQATEIFGEGFKSYRHPLL